MRGYGYLSPPHMACRASGRTQCLAHLGGLSGVSGHLVCFCPSSPGGLIVCDWGILGHSSRDAGLVGLGHLSLPLCHRRLVIPQERE